MTSTHNASSKKLKYYGLARFDRTDCSGPFTGECTGRKYLKPPNFHGANNNFNGLAAGFKVEGDV